ncbi:MAG: alpha/beta hydrolase [Lachnospiraceae bacterium]|nr:alpha/beta hydrolase [Lachnospiraceae bacterium]
MRPEENYTKFMEEQVLPCILPRREERYLSREPGRKIYCAFYTAGSCDNGAREKCSEQIGGKYRMENGGESSESSAKGIILISHGFTETADKYFELIYYFLNAGYHVCIPEHCGHGRSYRLVEGDLSLVHTDSWQRYVLDLSFAAHAAKKHWTQDLPFYLFAHSMGGGVGAALAAREPELFDRVVLSSPMIRPLTGGVPWSATKGIVAAMCLLGRERSYVIGQHAYDGMETFEMGFATSPARHAWYKEKTDKEPLYQTSGASYGWLREAIRLNHFLMKEAWKQITAPVLLLQAGNETVVSNEAQAEFVRKLAQKDLTRKGDPRAERQLKTAGGRQQASDSPQQKTEPVRLINIPGAKHEIFRSEDETLEKYLKYVLGMYE